MVGNSVGVVQKTINSVGNGAHSDWDAESQDVDGGGAAQMVLDVDHFISSISDQVGLESQTEWNVKGDISTDTQTCQLGESDPFEDSGVFIKDFSLFEVEL